MFSIRDLLFPAPKPPTYDSNSFPDDLIWVPHNVKDEGGNIKSAPIPCVFLAYKGGKRLVIYCHGNGCDLGKIHDELLRYRDYWKVHILAMEYPGYGLCEGTPSEASINRALYSVYDFVTRKLHWPSLFVFLYGRSIGTGPACHLARYCNKSPSTRVGGIILQCGYTSIRAVVAKSIGTLASNLITDRWQNIKAMKYIDCPVLLIHGQGDKLIPYEHSEKLYDACKSQHKQLIVVAEADHNTFDEEEDIKKPILKFIWRATALMQRTLKYYEVERKKKETLRSQIAEARKADLDPKAMGEQKTPLSSSRLESNPQRQQRTKPASRTYVDVDDDLGPLLSAARKPPSGRAVNKDSKVKSGSGRFYPAHSTSTKRVIIKENKKTERDRDQDEEDDEDERYTKVPKPGEDKKRSFVCKTSCFSLRSPSSPPSAR